MVRIYSKKFLPKLPGSIRLDMGDYVYREHAAQKDLPTMEGLAACSEGIQRIAVCRMDVLDKGYSTMGFASNQQAVAYRQELLADQLAMTARISEATGQELDVAWNLTLAGNIISANVRCGDIKTIEDMQGVSRVVLETRYEPCETEESSRFPPGRRPPAA